MLSRLAAALGPSQAQRELAWLRSALDAGLVDGPLHALVDRRVLGEPLQYILGTQPFGPLNLLARPPVLIPRPETEHWVTRLAEYVAPTIQEPVSLLDLGTGSACIPLLLCHLWPPGTVSARAVDISPHAIRLAQDNAALCGISSNLSDQSQKGPHNTFSVSTANILANDFANTVVTSRFGAPFDIVTSNPPYIPWKEYLELPREVIDFEDPKALFGGPSGLEFYHAIARFVSYKNILKPNALVALEVGHDQATTVETIMRQTGIFQHTELWPDPWGKLRTVIARTRGAGSL